VHRLARVGPARRIGAAEAVEDVLHIAEGERLGVELEGEDHRIDVLEEIEVDMRDLAGDWRGARLQHHAHAGDIAAAVDPDGGLVR
jgi:hypothetical protein